MFARKEWWGGGGECVDDQATPLGWVWRMEKNYIYFIFSHPNDISDIERQLVMSSSLKLKHSSELPVTSTRTCVKVTWPELNSAGFRACMKFRTNIYCSNSVSNNRQKKMPLCHLLANGSGHPESWPVFPELLVDFAAFPHSIPEKASSLNKSKRGIKGIKMII